MIRDRKRPRKKGEIIALISWGLFIKNQSESNTGLSIIIKGYNECLKKKENDRIIALRKELIKKNDNKVYDSKLQIVLEGEIKKEDQHWINSLCNVDDKVWDPEKLAQHIAGLELISTENHTAQIEE